MTAIVEDAEAATAAPAKKVTGALLITLALLSAVAPLATDLYLSAFPQMVESLSTTASGVQLSLTGFLIGVSIGQLVFGPLSDRFGRMGPLLVGVVIYLASSAVAALAPTIAVLVLARLVQGLSGAAGMVISRAVISDIAEGEAAAQAFSLMMLVGGVAPVLGPLAGSAMLDAVGWRGLLWVIAAVGAVSLIFVAAFLRETHPKEKRMRQANGPGLRVLLTPVYIGNALALGFAFSTMMAYISASPFVYQTMMGMTELQYGLVFGANSLVLTVVGGLSAKLVQHHAPSRLARIGLLTNLGAIAAITVVAVLDLPAVFLVVPLAVAVGALGLVFGNTTALALGAVREASGLGSAGLGVLQFALAGVVASLVGVGGETTAVPMALTMLAGSLIAITAMAVAKRAHAGKRLRSS
ncbi:MAG: multidrug effflux MFS transporter [Propionibacteriaceae bacterium]|jgi:DHA1 family bicyclomycin/chloramphenicol resistance-like MFS transporter|nr:multidrug effflux MFS transporter [Propionibacteriaceae bacterium]